MQNGSHVVTLILGGLLIVCCSNDGNGQQPTDLSEESNALDSELGNHNDGVSDTTGETNDMVLSAVEFWAYNIQDVSSARQYDELVGTHFDMYVLEVVTTEVGEEDFDIAGLVRDIRQHNIQTRGVNPIVLAYIDVGQAEDWRWYFESSWGIGNPDWIVGDDPDNWEGNYPVAFWDDVWENIVIYGHEGRSHIESSLQAGFDGVYMDWVEAFSDVNVVDKAIEEFDLDPEDGEEYVAELMFDFIEKIRIYAREDSPNADPDYLVIAQNASDLYEWDSTRYESIIDGIALEAIWYDGDGGFDSWDDPSGYNVPTNDLNPNWTEEVLGHLSAMQGRFPIFCVEYAQDVEGVQLADDVYRNLAPAYGFIPYATRRSLSRLSTTPYPLNYGDHDY